jgi:hypothetical protein
MSTTSPPDVRGNAGAPSATNVTSPTAAMAQAAAAEDLPAVVAGVATQYWAELVPIPSGPMKLSFFVDGAWRLLNGPAASILDVVQRAFLGTGSTVRVWYDGTSVVGLVVSG